MLRLHGIPKSELIEATKFEIFGLIAEIDEGRMWEIALHGGGSDDEDDEEEGVTYIRF